MNLSRRLCFLDIEASGLDTQTDRIIELALLVWDGNTVLFDRVRRFNPGIPIPPGATAIHGISDADVADKALFDAKVGRSILSVMNGCDLAGYNLRRFDLPILDEEMRRVGLKLELTDVQVLDVYGIFAKKEARTLSDAVKKYCGREHQGAHGAQSDTRATLDVLIGQMKSYPDLAAMDIHALASFSMVSEYEAVDVAGKLYRDKDGDVCYGFGKYRGVKVKDAPDYADWMLNRAHFPGSTNDVLRSELEKVYQEKTV